VWNHLQSYWLERIQDNTKVGSLAIAAADKSLGEDRRNQTSNALETGLHGPDLGVGHAFYSSLRYTRLKDDCEWEVDWGKGDGPTPYPFSTRQDQIPVHIAFW
jgi:hypothetical protein